jgi:uncharacterized protein YbjT (DUF2867 family)
MKYVVLGSLGHISKPLSEKLIAARNEVTIVSSKPERAEQILLMGAKAAIGSVEDVAFLTRTFKGADAVYTMVPPNFGIRDWKQYISKIGENIATAVKASGVKNVVNLSSIGAHMKDGAGPVSGLHYVERALDELNGVNVRHLRAGFFYTNFLSNIDQIKNMGVIGGNFGENTNLILVHPDDIAEFAFQELLGLSFKGKSIRYVASEEKTTTQIATTLGKAIGKPDLRWVNSSDKDTLTGLMKMGLPEVIAKGYTEMGSAMRSGELDSDYKKNRPSVFGRSKLESFATSVFATAYRQPQTTQSRVEH